MNDLALALWICCHPQRHPLSHQRFQTLAFYCFGMVLAQTGEAFQGVCFTAWTSGPACPALGQHYKGFRLPNSEPGTLEANPAPPHLRPDVEALCRAVLTVYGFMDTHRLHRQIHTEKPFLAANPAIDVEGVRDHFRQILNGPYTPPAYLFDAGSFALDGAPIIPYPSFSAFAEMFAGGPAEALTSEKSCRSS